MKHTGLFTAAFRRLAGLYALLAFVVTLSFTIPPIIAQRQAHESVVHTRQVPLFVQQSIGSNHIVIQRQIETFVSERDDDFKRTLTVRILEINGIMLLLTIVASYFLARYSLQPLQKVLDQQETFAAELAHELKTPLATALLELEELKRSGKNLTTEQQKRIGQLAHDIKDVGTLTEQTLAMMAVEYADVQQRFDSVQLLAILNSAKAMVTASAKKKHITLTIDDIPTATIRGNEMQLRQLFVALLDNAVKFTPDGGSIKVSGKVKQSMVHIVVADTGVGIPTELHEKIFHKFYQTDTGRSGSGLGLAIVRRIVELHNGSIAVGGALGKGATFTVSLPKYS